MRSLTSAFLFVAAVTLTGCERWALDRQMEELCKKDGGIRVYESVTLPPSEFNNLGQPLARYQQQATTHEQRLGPDYRYVTRRDVLVGKVAHPDKGQGRLARLYWGIYRRADGKLLGEQVEYQRIGGDGFTFGFQPSRASCPPTSRGLEASVFLKGH